MKLVISMGLACAMMTGCATWSGAEYKWPWKEGVVICDASDSCTSRHALAAYVQAQTFCRSVHNFYEVGDKRNGWTRVGANTVGALAGSVISQFTNGSAAKAWAGLSGATNALRSGLAEDFSTMLAANRRKAVADAADAGKARFMSATGPDEKVLEAIAMASDCSMAPGNADVEAMKAMAGASPQGNKNSANGSGPTDAGPGAAASGGSGAGNKPDGTTEGGK